MMLSVVLLLAAVASANALPHVTVDLNASATAIMADANATESLQHLKRYPKMPDLSHMRLRNVKRRRNWDWSDCSSPGSVVTMRDITVVPPFEDGVTSVVTFEAGQSAEVSMPGSAEVSLFYLGIPLGSSQEPVCPPADPEPCPWVMGDIEASFELPLDLGIGGNFRVKYDMSDGDGQPMFCVDLTFSL